MNRFFLLGLLVAGGCAPRLPSSPLAKPLALSGQNATAAATIAGAASQVPRLAWSVAGEFPHDTGAFTEGLLWKDGFLYESTGLEGRSEVRQVDLPSGQVVKRFRLAPQLFGEGLAFLNNRFFNLTWQSKVGFVLDPNFKPLARFSYRNEGWGLTTDGQRLLQSDGTDTLTWRSAADFSALGTLKVTQNGVPLRDLNELEWVRGTIWANVWQTDTIVVIDPKSGKVLAQLDLSGLLAPQERSGNEDVLNGIAYDAKANRVFVTGKNWPKLFWLRVEGAPQL